MGLWDEGAEGDEGDHYGKDRAEGWTTLWKVTIARGCPGVFSNWLLHEGVHQFFFFKLTIALRCPRGSRHHGNRLYGVMELWSKMFDWVSGVEWKPLRLLWLLEHLRCQKQQLKLTKSLYDRHPLWLEAILARMLRDFMLRTIIHQCYCFHKNSTNSQEAWCRYEQDTRLGFHQKLRNLLHTLELSLKMHCKLLCYHFTMLLSQCKWVS